MGSIDLSGGMAADVDEIAAEPPNPDFMEGANVWLWDDEGRVTLPRVAIDAMGARWDEAHMISVNAALPGGRVLVVRDWAPPHPAADAKGRPRVRGAGPLRFECLEPFRHWRVTFEGLAGETTTEVQIGNRFGGPDAVPPPTLPLAFEIDFAMTLAPWPNGAYEPDGATLSTERRFEQLCSAAGEVRIDGAQIPLRGGGLRIRRKGSIQRSDYSDWMGHVWMSAQFASGRAFGIDHFHPRPDGSVRYHEGWVRDEGEILPAKFVATPWKTDWIASGEDVSFTLRTKRGEVPISAETYVTTVNPIAQPPAGRAAFPSTQQGIVRCRWQGEDAYGMIERSSPLEERPATA
jgi:hypothetical protein